MDLSFLRDVLERPGPFATVYLDASHDTEDAAHADQLRWAQARSDLAEQGADEATLVALDASVAGADPPVGRAGRVLVAAGGEVLLDQEVPAPPALPGASWGPLPHLMPMLLELPEDVPAVAVRIDETGGEILVSAPREPEKPIENVEGGGYPVHKVRGGGWAHLNMQERVEESWRQNTAAVAGRVDEHVAAIDAAVLVLTGDSRSRSRLRDALAKRSVAIAVDVEHSADAGPDDLEAAVREAASDVVTADRRAVRERYEQAAGRPDGLAVEGLDAVLAAFRAEAVDTLLVHGGVEREQTVWISEVPTQLATEEAEVTAVGAEPAARVPVDTALLRAAAASGATFVPLGGDRTALGGRPLVDGVGAILRYPLPAGA